MRTWPALRVSGLIAGEDADSSPDAFQTALVDHQVVAIDESTATEWLVFFDSHSDRNAADPILTATFPQLTISRVDVDDEDWAARSQASLRAVAVGTIRVAPPWDRDESPTHLQIVIQPSMGFGTGHHATTRLCLRALQQLPLTGRRVVDVGTGSGVLAIAASLLGASYAVGIDDDGDAIQAAVENLALNPLARVEFLPVDLRSFAGAFDVVVANLTGGLLAATAEQLETLTTPGGRLILSGLMTQEVAMVLPHFAASRVIGDAAEDEWASVVLERR